MVSWIHRSIAITMLLGCCACAPLAVESPQTPVSSTTPGANTEVPDSSEPDQVNCCVKQTCQLMSEQACMVALLNADNEVFAAAQTAGAPDRPKISLLGSVYELLPYNGEVLKVNVVSCEKAVFRATLGFVYRCRLMTASGAARVVNWPWFSHRPEKNHPNFSDPTEAKSYQVRIETWQGIEDVITGAIELGGVFDE